MEHFNDELRPLRYTKMISLMLGLLGSAAFIAVIVLVSFTSNVDSLSKNMVLIHFLHTYLFFAMIFINGSITKMSFLALYSGLYLFCALGDTVGAVIRTVYLVQCTDCSTTTVTIVWLELGLEYAMVVIAVAQFIVGIYMAKIVGLHMINQQTVVNYVCSTQQQKGTEVSKRDRNDAFFRALSMLGLEVKTVRSGEGSRSATMLRHKPAVAAAKKTAAPLPPPVLATLHAPPPPLPTLLQPPAAQIPLHQTSSKAEVGSEKITAGAQFKTAGTSASVPAVKQQQKTSTSQQQPPATHTAKATPQQTKTLR